MTDRELLELAAKAVGIQIAYFHSNGSPMVRDGAGTDQYWNPLTNDGDALRLAVKLSLEIYIDEGTATTCQESNSFRLRGIGVVCESHVPGDFRQQCAATRRAIIRAAAIIGKET